MSSEDACKYCLSGALEVMGGGRVVLVEVLDAMPAEVSAALLPGEGLLVCPACDGLYHLSLVVPPQVAIMSAAPRPTNRPGH